MITHTEEVSSAVGPTLKARPNSDYLDHVERVRSVQEIGKSSGHLRNSSAGLHPSSVIIVTVNRVQSSYNRSSIS
jgi:hypothetical protein